MLGWVVREIQRTFFNRAPVVRPQETTLVLSPNETSSPTPFQSYDLDDDGLTYFVPARGEVGGPMHGWVEVDQVTGTFTYTRDDDYVGPDQFTVTVSDAGSRCREGRGGAGLRLWGSSVGAADDARPTAHSAS